MEKDRNLAMPPGSLGRITRAIAALVLAGLLFAASGTGAQEPAFDPMALIAEGNRAMAAGDLGGAAAIFSRGIDDPQATDRFRVSFYVRRARVRALQGRLDNALADADAAVSHSSENEPNIARGNVYAVRGMLRREAGQTDGARKDLGTAYRLLQEPDDEYAEMLTNMANTNPAHAERLRRQHEALLDTVWMNLQELRKGN